MMIANVSQRSAVGLPLDLTIAQQAICLPEVQEMLRRLAHFKLGIFMPHSHDDATGDFQVLSDEVIQVESGLEVSFRASEEITNQPNRFLPVGWCWHAGAVTVSAVCEMVQDETAGYPKHKMLQNG